MHETTLAAGLLRIIEEEAQKHNVQRMVRIQLGLGVFACIEAQTLKGCFELLAENTVAHGAALDIQIMPLQCRCDNCSEEFTLTKRAFACPHCHSAHITFNGGHGCTLLSLEAPYA